MHATRCPNACATRVVRCSTKDRLELLAVHRSGRVCVICVNTIRTFAKKKHGREHERGDNTERRERTKVGGRRKREKDMEEREREIYREREENLRCCSIIRAATYSPKTTYCDLLNKSPATYYANAPEASASTSPPWTGVLKEILFGRGCIRREGEGDG